jgi:tRNA(adenine34) deaminase
MNDIHIKFMKMALIEAERARQKDEVPVGAVLVSESGRVLSRGHNNTIGLSDPTAHAEILTLRKAAKKGMNYRLLNSILYVTIEPCVMCMGAIIHARVRCVVFGAADPKWGACGSVYDFASNPKLNHRPEIISGISEPECRDIIQRFFQEKRYITQ